MRITHQTSTGASYQDSHSNKKPTRRKFTDKWLPSPDSIRFVAFTVLWYSCSALTNTCGKVLLSQYKFPFTLTWFQFGFVSLFSMLSAKFKLTPAIQKPNTVFIKTSAALSLFQIAGHVFSSIAISNMPVSLVHTIKALSPLFTVVIYSSFLQTRFPKRIYLSLIPLTIGVILVSTHNIVFSFVGMSSAFLSTLIFVIQTIFSKTVFYQMSDSNSTLKFDKMNLLFYSNTASFVFMLPLWIFSEASEFLAKLPSVYVVFLFVVNGISHYAQNWMAFSILAMVSPVTYSIASLLKRIFVITASIIFFGDHVTALQALGIALTFVGLYMYDKSKHMKQRQSTAELPTFRRDRSD